MYCFGRPRESGFIPLSKFKVESVPKLGRNSPVVDGESIMKSTEIAEGKGLRISESDWSAFLGHLNSTLQAFQVPPAERDEVVAFGQTTKADTIEA